MFPFCMLYKIEPPFKVASLSIFHLRGIVVTTSNLFHKENSQECSFSSWKDIMTGKETHHVPPCHDSKGNYE